MPEWPENMETPRDATNDANVDDVVRLFRNVLPWMMPSGGRPSLECIHLAFRPPRLYMVALSPYTATVDSALIASSGEPFDLPIREAVAQRMLADLRDKSVLKAARVTFKRATNTGYGGQALYYGHDATMTERTWKVTDDMNPPAYQNVLPRGPGEPVGRISLNPMFIERLGKVLGLSYAATFTFYGAQAGVQIAVGETFRAIVMPLRMPD